MLAGMPKPAAKNPLSSVLVPRAGFEPASLAAYPPQGYASASFATWASLYLFINHGKRFFYFKALPR